MYLFNTNNYYSLIEQFYDQMVSNEFLTQEDRDKILFSNSFQEIEEFIKTIKHQKLEPINQNCFININACPIIYFIHFK